MALKPFFTTPRRAGHFLILGGVPHGRPIVATLRVFAEGAASVRRNPNLEVRPPFEGGDEYRALQGLNSTYPFQLIPSRLMLYTSGHIYRELIPVLNELVRQHGWAFAYDGSRGQRF